MTALTKRRTKLTFETAAEVRERGKLRAVVIEAQPSLCIVRLKGMRRSYAVSWAGVFNLGAHIAAEKAREDRKAARKLKKGRA